MYGMMLKNALALLNRFATGPVTETPHYSKATVLKEEFRSRRCRYNNVVCDYECAGDDEEKTWVPLNEARETFDYEDSRTYKARVGNNDVSFMVYSWSKDARYHENDYRQAITPEHRVSGNVWVDFNYNHPQKGASSYSDYTRSLSKAVSKAYEEWEHQLIDRGEYRSATVSLHLQGRGLRKLALVSLYKEGETYSGKCLIFSDSDKTKGYGAESCVNNSEALAMCETAARSKTFGPLLDWLTEKGYING